MRTRMFLLIALICVISLCLVEAQRKKKGQKKPGKQGGKPAQNLKQAVDQLRKEFDDLKAHLDHSHDEDEGHAVSKCGNNKIHFYFQGQDPKGHGHDDSNHHDDDDVHVHVDLHLADSHHGDEDGHDHIHTASCQFDNGYAYIIQHSRDDFAKFKFSFDKIDYESFDLHVHENGDMRKGCGGLGGHHDPIDKDKDVGDLGKIRPAVDDISEVWFNETKLTIIGEDSIIGLSIVGHDSTDGTRVTCCVIGRAADDHSHYHDSHDHHSDGHGHHGHGHHSDGHDHDGHDHKHHGDDKDHDGDDSHYHGH